MQTRRWGDFASLLSPNVCAALNEDDEPFPAVVPITRHDHPFNKFLPPDKDYPPFFSDSFEGEDVETLLPEELASCSCDDPLSTVVPAALRFDPHPEMHPVAPPAVNSADDDLSSIGSASSFASLREVAAKVDKVVLAPTPPDEIHSVSPTCLACRKRLTMTANRSTDTIQAVMSALRRAVALDDWQLALQVTLHFCCCISNLPSVPNVQPPPPGDIVLTCLDEMDGTSDDRCTTSASSGGGYTTRGCAESELSWSAVRVNAASLMSYDDFAMLCASLFERVIDKSPGNPLVLYPKQTAIGRPPTQISPGARSLRQLICDVQTLLLMCMATKLDMQPSEQLRMKNLVASALYALVWHPSTLEALSPIFFIISGQSTSDCFCSFLIHWGGTGVLQLIFEVFLLILVRRARWRAALWLLSCTALGEGFLLPSIRLKELLGNEPFLPEVGNIESCRSEILARLRFPVGAVTDILLDLSTYQLPGGFHDQPWPFETEPRDLILSILPLVLCKTYSDEIMVYRGWHDRARGECPITDFSPEQILRYLRWQIAHPLAERELLGEDDLAMDHVLDEVVPAFVFLADDSLREQYLKIVPSRDKGWLMDRRATNELTVWQPSIPSVLAPRELFDLLPPPSRTSSGTQDMEDRSSPTYLADTYLRSKEMLDLWHHVADHPEALDRCLCFVEIAGRITETYFVNNKCCSPFSEVIELNTRESLLQMSKRTVGELTGCTLGRVDLCYLRLLESFETIYGVPSQLSGLVGPRKGFHACLNMSLLSHCWTLVPLLKGPFRYPAITRSPDSSEEDQPFVFPTLLPIHVAELLPAWLAARTHGSPYEDGKRGLSGWRILAREIMVAASRTLERFPHTPTVAPHLDCALLNIFLPLYVEAANPRALHLLTRLAIAAKKKRFKDDMPSYLFAILERAEKSKFVLIADAISQITLYDVNDPSNAQIARKVMEVYLAANDSIRAIRHLEGVKRNPSCVEALEPYVQAAHELFAQQRDTSKAITRTGQIQFSKEERLRNSLSVVKSLAAANDVKGAVSYFYELRNSTRGILDISVANKIMHLCVTNSHFGDAWEILRVMRADSHSEINGMDFIPGACVRPDVVTCNIAIKGLARQRPPIFEEIDKLIAQMEKPFHLGGDGVKPDQVTFNTAITAAVQAGEFERAWSYFGMMRQRNIKIDGFTCSILVRQLEPTTPVETIEEISALVDDLDLYEDGALLSSLVDVYSDLRETTKLKKLLDRYQAKVQNPSPYAIATAIKGYSRCNRMKKAAALWRKLEERTDVRWSSYVLTSAVEAFTSYGRLNEALNVVEKAKTHDVLVGEVQLSALIRLCISNQRFGEALNLYKHMRTHHLNPCDVTYNSLMHSCVQAGDLETAMDILNDMSSQGENHPPDIVTYSTILKGLCDKGAMESAMKLFKSLPARGLKPDVVTYNTILEGFAKINNLEKVESTFQELLASRVKPTCFTLTILVKFYGRRRMVENVLQLVEHLPQAYKFKLDNFVYTATIAACSWNGKLPEALRFLLQMRETFGASTRTYGTVIAGSVKHQHWGALSAVLKLVQEDGIELERRDACVLKDLYRRWYNGTLGEQWLASGFDINAAEELRYSLSQLRA